MADISKCKGTDCPLKETCYRYTAPSGPVWQSYLAHIPYNEEKKECHYYCPTTFERREKRQCSLESGESASS